MGMVMDWRDMAGRSTLEHSPSLAETTSEHFWSWMPSRDSLTSWSFLGHGDIDAHVDPPIILQEPHGGGQLEEDSYLLGGWRISLDYSTMAQAERTKRTLPLSTTVRSDIRPSLPRDENEASSPLANPNIRDPLRGWVISIGWLLASGVECVLTHGAVFQRDFRFSNTATSLITVSI